MKKRAESDLLPQKVRTESSGCMVQKFNDDKRNCLDWSSEVEGGNKSEHVMTWLFVAKTKPLCLWDGMYSLTDSLLQIHFCQVSNESQ